MRRLLLLALLATACTGPDEVALRDADPSARPGGVLRVGTTAPGSVDPGNVYEPVGELVVRTMCTPLLTTDPETSELLPGVVESWLVSDDGRSLTLRLREDLVFSDGSPLTAEDVAFTLDRVASASYASTSAALLSPVLGYPQRHGDEPTDEDLDRERLAGVEVREEGLQLTLREPLGDFVRRLASPVLSPVKRSAAESDPRAFARNPVCVGPYRLAAPWSPGDPEVRLVRSAAHRPVDAARTAGGRGFADEVVFRSYPDTAAAAAAARAGEVDLAPAEPGDVDLVQVAPGPAVELLGLPLAVFDDARVRRAVSLALDRDELVRRVFPGTREPADGFLPVTAPADDACPAVRRDLPAARALLAEAGVDLTGAPLPLAYDDSGRQGQLAAEVARQLQEGIGLAVQPTPLPPQEFLSVAESSAGFPGLFRYSWSVPYPDVDGYLHPLYATRNVGRTNAARWSDPVLDRALERTAREASDAEDRRLGYAAALEQLCETVPMVPLTTSLSRWLVAPAWQPAGEAHLDGSTGQPLLADLWRS